MFTVHGNMGRDAADTAPHSISLGKNTCPKLAAVSCLGALSQPPVLYLAPIKTSLLFTECFAAVSCRPLPPGILPEARLIDRIRFGQKRVSFLINQREPRHTHTHTDERAPPSLVRLSIHPPPIPMSPAPGTLNGRVHLKPFILTGDKTRQRQGVESFGDPSRRVAKGFLSPNLAKQDFLLHLQGSSGSPAPNSQPTGDSGPHSCDPSEGLPHVAFPLPVAIASSGVEKQGPKKDPL